MAKRIAGPNYRSCHQLRHSGRQHHHPQLHHDAFPRSGHGELAGWILGERSPGDAVRTHELLERRNGVIDSPIKLPMDYTLRYRLIADEGKELVNGDTVATVIDVDVDDVDKWVEQDAPKRNER